MLNNRHLRLKSAHHLLGRYKAVKPYGRIGRSLCIAARKHLAMAVCAIVLVLLPDVAAAQSGPGGVSTSNLNFWLRADRGVTTDASGVTQWADQTANSRNGIATSGGGRQPAYLPTGGPNGMGALDFDGSSDFLTLPDASLPTGDDPYTILTVVNGLTGGAPGILGQGNYPNTNQTLALRYGGTTLYTYWFFNDLSGGSLASGTSYIAGTDYANSAVPERRVLVDGSVVASDSPAASRNGGAANASVGATLINGPSVGWSVEYFDGLISEVLVFSERLADAERTLAENYLSGKYNIAIAKDRYAGDTAGNGNFDFGIAGIGREADGASTSAEAEGLLVTDGGYLTGADNYLMVGHNNSAAATVATSLPTYYTARWARTWFADYTSGSGAFSLAFDFSDAGFGSGPVSPVAYRLLYRPAGSTGNFVPVDAGGSMLVGSLAGDRVSFAVNSTTAEAGGVSIADGEYTLGWFNLPDVDFTTASQSVSEATASATITAVATSAVPEDITVPYTVNGLSTATPGESADYEIPASPVTIPSGSTTATVTITVHEDTEDEADETVIVDMGTPTNAVANGTLRHELTIVDNEAKIEVSSGSVISNGGTLAIGNLDVDATTGYPSKTITIKNIGDATSSLAITSVSRTAGDADFTVGGSFSSPLAKDATTTFTVTFDPAAAGARSATISIVNSDADETPFTFTVTGTGLEADLSVSKTITAGANPTRTSPVVTFQISVTNDDNGAQSVASTGFTVTDTFPAGFDPATTAIATCTGFVAAGTTTNTITLTHGSLAVGSTATCTLTARVDDDPIFDPDASYTNSATISAANEHDSQPADNTDTAAADPREADLNLSTTARSFDPADGSLTLTLTLTNNGPDAATNVTVTDPELNEGASVAPFLSVSANPSSGTYSGNVWTIPSIASGASITLDFSATVSVEHTVQNTAQVTASEEFDRDSKPANGITTEDDHTIEIIRQYDFGDADNYGSARHEIISGAAILGSLVDSEAAHNGNTASDGDDTTGLADEDGVVIPIDLGAGVPGGFDVTASGAAYLSAWIDYNGNDAFEGGERFYSGSVASGTQTISVTPPTSSVVNTYARFRICSVQADCDNPTEDAPNGEVEDYAVTILGIDFGDAPDASSGAAAGNYLTTVGDDGARHQTGSAYYLGTTAPDNDADANQNGDATGDDGTMNDDEDGVTFFSTLLVDATGTVGTILVRNAGAGYLNVWVDWDRSGTWGNQLDEVVIDDVSVSAGIDSYSFSIPASTAAGTTFLRARFCSTVATCDSPAGFVTDGEVEDYEVTLVDAAGATPAFNIPDEGMPGQPTLQLDAGGNLQLVAGGETLMQVNGAPFGALTVTGSTEADVLTVNFANGDPLPPSATGGLVFSGGSEDDHLVIDIAGGTVPTNTITYAGGSQASSNPGDILTFQDTVVSPHTIQNVHVNASSGTASIDDTGTGGGRLDVVYSGLEPVIWSVNATIATFTYTGGTETITLNNGGSDDGFSTIDSSLGESNTFINPSERLIINAGDGNDTILVGELDTGSPPCGGCTPTYPTAGVDPGIYVNGDDEGDYININPSVNYAVYADGNAPSTCLDPDVLDVTFNPANNEQFSAPVTDLTTSPLPIQGIVDPMPVYQTNFEVFAFAVADLAMFDYEIADSVSYAGEYVRVLVKIRNQGPDASQCVSVNLTDLPPVINIDVDDSASGFQGPVASEGALDKNTLLWTLDEISGGETDSLVFYGVVDTPTDGTYGSTISVSGVTTDPIGSNNLISDTLRVVVPFVLPAKLHVQSAVWTTLITGQERLLLGMYQGSPSLSTGVLCRTPDADNDIFNQESLGVSYLPCGQGLPYPIHVNDMWLDDDGTMAGRIYLTTWGGEGLYYSEDDGETWSAAQPKLNDGRGGTSSWVAVYAIVEDAADGVLYLSANNGLIFRSVDNGGIWQQVGSLPEGSATTSWTLETDPANPGTVYAGTAGHGVYKSEDFGYSWTQTTVTQLAAGDAAHIFDLEFNSTGSHLFAGTSRGTWVTTDGGTTWSQVDPNEGNLTPTGLAPEIRRLTFGKDIDSDSQPDLYAAAWGFGVLVNKTPITGGAGTTGVFSTRTSEATLLAAAPDGTMYVAGEGGLSEIDPTTIDVVYSVANESLGEVPTEFDLDQNYPNPFNPRTSIGYRVPETSNVTLTLFDALGREIRVLASGTHQAGHYQIDLDGSTLTTGVYLYRLSTPEGAITRMLTLLK